MFDNFAKEVIGQLPRLADLDPIGCRRALSEAYLIIVHARIEAQNASQDTLKGIRQLLRRMASALESAAVFDVPNGVPLSPEAVRAAAFTAAEALSLFASLVENGRDEHPSDPIQDEHIYTLIESGLLFMVGGYDINATAVMAEAPEPLGGDGDGPAQWSARSGIRLFRRIKALCEGKIGGLSGDLAPQDFDSAVLWPDALLAARASLYEALCRALDSYSIWLSGPQGIGVEGVLGTLAKVRDTCRTESPTERLLAVQGFSDVRHLSSLLAAAVRTTSGRSVVHGVPAPLEGNAPLQFGDYLRRRAVGTSQLRGRPFLWPSALEFVRECLPGPNRDAVISMPTGSGKSFLAELAVAHALARGWVLYLTPTNALAHQVRRDLTSALAAFSEVSVVAFVGGAEYSVLSDDKPNADASSDTIVAVMTPEKCALALRLSPEAFRTCSLCVFDECHLINDESRGAVADVLLAQLFHAAPNMRVLLMSAMVSNGEELAGWLTAVRGGSGSHAMASRIRWRPSRAARGFVFVDEAAYKEAERKGQAQLHATSKAMTVKHELPLAWLTGLSGPWSSDGPEDYRTAPLPLTASYHQKRSRKGVLSSDFESWKNTTGLAVAELMASHGMPAIDFVLSSRHHAFGLAERVARPMPGAVGLDALPDLVSAQLAIADAELGVSSCLRELLGKGVAVHTSAMLQVEQAASEWMFAKGHAMLMVATGTLAQGLNLPALAVVVSGSQLAGVRPGDVDAAAGLTRANELILNGFGRAGRPGFANQGVVILVSDRPFVASVNEAQNGADLLHQYPVLAEPDASIAVHSPIERFIDQVTAQDQANAASSLELALTALLSTVDGDGENASSILRRTFGGYRRRNMLTNERAELAQIRIAEVREHFLQGVGVPIWMPTAAMRAGVHFFRAQRMWEAFQAHGLPSIEELEVLSIGQWLETLIQVLSRMPVAYVEGYLDEKATVTPRTRLGEIAKVATDRDCILTQRPAGWEEAWRDLGRVVDSYMAGRPLSEVGALLFGCRPDEFTPKRGDGGRGIPAVFKFINDIVDRALSQDAGCLLAIFEGWLEAEHQGAKVPESLQALPLCIRNGADSLDVLAWYRFGYRQRVCAHALASAFPLTVGVSGDDARALEVRGLRRGWLSMAPASAPTLIDYARTVVLEGSSDRN